jgi:hypothetical protein
MKITGLKIKLDTAQMRHDEMVFARSIKALGYAYHTLSPEVVEKINHLAKSFTIAQND